MNITYKNTITADEVNAIRKSMGWRQLPPDERMQAELDEKEFLISAYDEDKAVGMATSGGTILLMPDYQFKGIENEFFNRIFDFTRKKLRPGDGISIEIRAWNEKQIALYESLGFQISTPELRGIPMHICLTNQIELTDKRFKQMEFKEE
ncbi:MAG: GNAT family N-acetyltransferase [Oscillospiraceae bacterium]|nr:GNAT family N-acetyltransferase [Oscillospiraceae bacterium]